MKFAIRYGLLALIFTTNSLFAQAPKGINYQGIARDMEGKPLAQREISIRISVLAGSAEGEVEYDEIHEVRTNSFGLFTLVIGQGQAGMGAFNFISWALGDKWLQIELDENGGRNFQLMGSQQLMSVPYALYAEFAGNGYAAGEGISISNNTITNTGDGDVSSTNELITGVSFGVDNKLRITDAGGTQEADLSTLVGASQNLSGVLAQGNDAGSVAITNLGSPVNNSDAATKAYVDSHTDGDPDAGNEIQDLSLTTNSLKITNNPSAASIDLSPFLDNTDNQNLTSSASGTNRTVNISGGTGTTINVADNDNSGTNEIQTLSKTGSSISLTSGGSVVLNDDNATNEAQTISRAGSNLSLSQVSGTGGGSVSIDDADANPINEAQTLSKAGAVVSLSNVSGSGGGSFTLNDDSGTNEAQTLSKIGSSITLSNVGGTGGGSVVLNDDSNTNEAQTISRAGNTVTLTPANGSGGGSFTVDPDATNEIQNLSQVLTTGNSAGSAAITNLANPTNAQDATTKNYVDAADNALSLRIANTYAFKVSYNHTHSAPVTQVVSITAEDFDDFSLVTGNSFVTPENGTYQFTVSGTSPIGGIAMQIRVTPISGLTQLIDIKRQSGYPIASEINYFDSTVLKLSAGHVVELIVSSGITNEVVVGTFFGFKL